MSFGLADVLWAFNNMNDKKYNFKKIKSILLTIGIIIVVLFFLFIYIKGSIVKIWTSPISTTIYAINGADGRSLKMIFLPKNKTIMYYKNSNNNAEEYTLTEMRGAYGTHYILGLWKLNGPGTFYGGLLGYRIYHNSIKPVIMETKTMQKYMSRNGDSNFPQIGKTTYSTILFKDDSVKFEGMWLQKEKTDDDFILRLLNNLGTKNY